MVLIFDIRIVFFSFYSVITSVSFKL